MDIDVNDISKTIGKNIKKARINKINSVKGIKKEKANYSLEHLAKKLGVSKSSLSQLENGKIISINFEKVLNLCKELEVDFFSLFDETTLSFSKKENSEFTNLYTDFKQYRKCLVDTVIEKMYNIYISYNENIKKIQNPISFNKKIGFNIKMIREQQNLSQNDLAKKINCKSANTIYRIENGITTVSFTRLLKICASLNINFYFIFSNFNFTEYSINLPLKAKYCLLDKKDKEILNFLIDKIRLVTKYN